MFKKLLVANRGEIARRIFRACQELGVRTVAIYSEADAQAAWTRDADEAYLLKGVTAQESYLNQEAILAIAQQAQVEAIHPGYGFLSENGNFALACRTRGIRFVGPTPEAIWQLGSKATARSIAQTAGVPVIPGADGLGKTSAELLVLAEKIGFPVLIKASAGGGGKGMRVVWNQGEFLDALQAAQNEALSAFGDDHVLLEKYFTEIHHVEVQVLGDGFGNVVHLFERECSIQRRHQKIIEESPAPVLMGDLRERMTQAAVALAKVVGYESAGTVEFVVDQQGQFYLLEMNTRLQVEHPVTESVTGIDLATWQIRVAAGQPLSFRQTDLSQRGHALECRIYAEDPAHHFLPSIGKISFYQPPTGVGVRVDDGIATGSSITPYYDPMLAKVISWGADRPEAIRKMVRALRETVILGVTTNIPYLVDILNHPDFMAGHTPTNFLERKMPAWQPTFPTSNLQTWLAMAAYEWLPTSSAAASGQEAATPISNDPWTTVNRWRNV